jgi:hypothetical protein
LRNLKNANPHSCFIASLIWAEKEAANVHQEKVIPFVIID